VENAVLDGKRLAVAAVEPRCEKLAEGARVHTDFLQSDVQDARLGNTRVPDSLLDSRVEEVHLILGKPPQGVPKDPRRLENVGLVDCLEERLQAAEDRRVVLACLLVRKRLRKAEGQEDALDDIERDVEVIGGLRVGPVDDRRRLRDVVEIAKGQLSGCDRCSDLLGLYAGALEGRHGPHAVNVARSKRFLRIGRREDSQLDEMLQSVACRARPIGQLTPRKSPGPRWLGRGLSGRHRPARWFFVRCHLLVWASLRRSIANLGGRAG
jgi:hypothetical protein